MPSPPCLFYGTCGAEQPFVSIAIPTYGRLGLLFESLSSVLCQQTSSSFEVIVVDNDQSAAILDVVGQFPSGRLAVYQNPKNLGLWGNLNRALELSRGEWVLFLPDDDLLRPGALEAFERLISPGRNGHMACLVGGVQLLIDESRRPVFDLRTSWTRFPVAFNPIGGNQARVIQVTSDIRFHDIPKLCSSFFRRDALAAQGGWDDRCGGYADVAAFLRIQSRGQLFACQEIFGCFRVHEGNLSRPEKLWESYPVASAYRLFGHYVREGTETGKSIRAMVEKIYTSALWKHSMREEMRRKRAEELLRLIVRDTRRRFLLRNLRLLSALAWMYSQVRPALGRASRLVFGRVRRSKGSARAGASVPMQNGFAGEGKLG